MFVSVCVSARVSLHLHNSLMPVLLCISECVLETAYYNEDLLLGVTIWSLNAINLRSYSIIFWPISGILIGSADHYTYSRCLKYEGQSQCGVGLVDGDDVIRNNTTYSSQLYAERARHIIYNHDPQQVVQGIVARTHAHPESAHFPARCIIRGWEARGLQLCALHALMMLCVLAFITWPVRNIKPVIWKLHISIPFLHESCLGHGIIWQKPMNKMFI